MSATAATINDFPTSDVGDNEYERTTPGHHDRLDDDLYSNKRGFFSKLFRLIFSGFCVVAIPLAIVYFYPGDSIQNASLKEFKHSVVKRVDSMVAVAASMFSPPTSTKVASVSKTDVVISSKTKSHESNKQLTAADNVNGSSVSVPTPDYILKLQDSVSMLTNRYARLDIALNKLATQVREINSEPFDTKALRNEINTQTKSLKTNINQLADQLPRLANDTSMLRTNLERLSNKVADNNKALVNLTSIKKQERISRPPFLLLSIDEWGDQDSAVIELNGKISTALPGDIRAGWRITTIEKPNCVVLTSTNSDSPKDTKLCSQI